MSTRQTTGDRRKQRGLGNFPDTQYTSAVLSVLGAGFIIGQSPKIATTRFTVGVIV